MKKSTKGAIAAGAAGVLLLGGAGTLAYWSETANVGGGTFTAGSLEVTGNTCTTADWLLDGGSPVATGATRIVPGDTISKDCTITITGVGDHLDDVAFAVTTGPAWSASNDLTTALGSPVATFTAGATDVTAGGDVPLTAGVATVDVNIEFTFASATSGDVAETLAATLNDVVVTVTQNHL